MIEVYTDASVSNRKAVVTCLALEPSSFIGCNVNEYTNVASSLHGELLGIRDALEYVLKHTELTDPIVIYCDSNTALEMVNKRTSKNSDRYSNIIRDIRKLKETHEVTLKLIKGHQSAHNPNKVVDLISNSVLRNSQEVL